MLQPETFATCKADLMISGDIQAFQYVHGTEMREYIAFDSTISRDGHPGETYDFCISNPPFGTPWKEDLKKRGLTETEKKKFTDSRFTLIGEDDMGISFIPDIGDCQMMFLANNLSRMKNVLVSWRFITALLSLQAMLVVVQVTFVNILLKMTCWKQLWLCQKKTSTIQVLVHLYGL